MQLELSDDDKKNYALVEVGKLMRICGRSLREFETMPYPKDSYFQGSQNRLILDELRYNRNLLREEHKSLLNNLNNEQRQVYDTIMDSIESGSGEFFFVYGYGGTGKTFVWRTLSAAIRSKGDIVLNVASSGIASLLLPGGRTAHSRFAIPLNPDEYSTCNIFQGSPTAELVKRSKLIIWYEAPMMHKHCFEALDRTLRDIMGTEDLLFGGKTVVLGGDFRQILLGVCPRMPLRGC
ncbi:hypothetical protein OROGR_013595 [Orobanche gracilis]